MIDRSTRQNAALAEVLATSADKFVINEIDNANTKTENLDSLTNPDERDRFDDPSFFDTWKKPPIHRKLKAGLD